MPQIAEGQIDKAVDWWVQTISNVGPENFDNGDPVHGKLVQTLALGNALAADAFVTPEKIAKFRESLRTQLVELTHTVDSNRIILSCDYHPGQYLWDAAQEADIDESVFPWKTVMWIEPDKIEVKMGYDAESQVLA